MRGPNSTTQRDRPLRRERPRRGPLLSALTLVLALIPTLATAQDQPLQDVRGYVVDADTNEPVSFAQVTFIRQADDQVQVQVTADTLGSFLARVLPGTYTVQVQRLGYGPISEPLLVRSREPVLLELRLSVEGISLEPLVITARGALERGRDGFARRMQLGRGVFLNQDSIQAREPIEATDSFRGVQGIVVTRPPEGPANIYTMSGAQCLVVYVDHVPAPFAIGARPSSEDVITTPVVERFALGGGGIFEGQPPTLAAGGLGLDMVVNPDNIVGIEVYRDWAEVPQELKQSQRLPELWPEDRTQPCGLAWIWTNSGW